MLDSATDAGQLAWTWSVPLGRMSETSNTGVPLEAVPLLVRTELKDVPKIVIRSPPLTAEGDPGLNCISVPRTGSPLIRKSRSELNSSS